MSEIYFSVDVETDGPIPGDYSMLSLGAIALTEDGATLGTFAINLRNLPGAGQCRDTMAWWQTQPEAWAACREDQIEPREAIEIFRSWVVAISGAASAKPVFVGYPAGFDFLFVYWYLIHFLGKDGSPFSFSALDLKTLGMIVTRSGYREVSKRSLKKFASGRPHTHCALDDAREQGDLFVALMREARR